MATVTLNWNEPSNSLGGVATGYDVWRKAGAHTGTATVPSDNNGDITGWTKINSSTVGQTLYADGELASGTETFAYTVTAKNSGGYSDGCIPVNVSGLQSS